MRQQSFVAPLSPTLKCLHGDLHGLPSARQLSRSVSQLSTSQASTAGRAGGRRAAWLNVHLSSQWLVGPLRVSSVPKMGALTHPLLPKRPGLADHRPTPSQSHATAPIRPAATQMGPLLLLGQLRQSHPVSAIFGSGSHSQLQVHRSPRRHWLADLVGERASASAMACRSIANCKG